MKKYEKKYAVKLEEEKINTKVIEELKKLISSDIALKVEPKNIGYDIGKTIIEAIKDSLSSKLLKKEDISKIVKEIIQTIK